MCACTYNAASPGIAQVAGSRTGHHPSESACSLGRRHAHTSALPMACCHAPWTSLGTYTLWGSINSLDCRSRGMPMSSRGASCSSMRRHPSGSATPAVKHTYAHIYTHAYTHTPIHTRLYTRAYTQRQCICHRSGSVTLLRCVTLYPTTCLQPSSFFLKIQSIIEKR